MDQNPGGERERDIQQQRADARERVRVAQDRETTVREVRRRDARQRSTQRQPLATQEARQPVETGDETGETLRSNGPGVAGGEETT